MENKRTHLNMIQGIINRLARNSFLLKGWTVIVVSALFALAANNTNASFIYLAYFPAVAFWILDGYYLWQEKFFRALYNYVRGLNEESIDFAMDTSIVSDQVDPWLKVIISTTLRIFYGIVLASIIIVMLIIV